MKETPLTGKHQALGAKMAAFAGYNMPISYAGIQEEHHSVRTNVGVFDVSHMGEFIVKGKEALQLIQYVTTNDASKLSIGQAQYSCLPNSTGGIIDDLLVYRLPEDMCAAGEQAFMLVVNASNIEKDFNWIASNNQFDTRLINISDVTGLLAVQGPKAMEVLQHFTDIDLASMKYYTFVKGRLTGLDNVLISATGYTGAGGFEIYATNEQISLIWDLLMEKQVQPIGLGARDTLRLEKGYCLYGNDIDDTTSPLEAGLQWITKFDKETFIAKDILVNQKNAGINRKLVGFTVEGRRVPRHGYEIQDINGRSIGQVTSGTLSPSLEIPIGMGYVSAEFSKPGNEIYILAGNKPLKAQVSKLPFL